jgi:hypothetical protein
MIITAATLVGSSASQPTVLIHLEHNPATLAQMPEAIYLRPMTPEEKRQRSLLRLLGVDTRRLSRTEVAEGAEAARRISQCEYVCGANKRRPGAVKAWEEWYRRITANVTGP